MILRHRYLVHDKLSGEDVWKDGLSVDWECVIYIHGYTSLGDDLTKDTMCVIGLPGGDSFVIDVPLRKAEKYFDESRKGLYLHGLN